MTNRSESPTWTLNYTSYARLDTVIGLLTEKHLCFGRVNFVYFFCKRRD